MERVPITGYSVYIQPGDDDLKAVVQLQLDTDKLRRPRYFDVLGFDFDVLINTRLIFSDADDLPRISVRRKQFGRPIDVELIYFPGYMLGAVVDTLRSESPVYLELETSMPFDSDFYQNVAITTGSEPAGEEETSRGWVP